MQTLSAVSDAGFDAGRHVDTTFNPMLAEAVAASLFPEHVVVPLRGWLAWLIWRGCYLTQMPTLRRTWDLFFRPDITHMRFQRTSRLEATCFGVRPRA